jgi:hypothetical protein
LPYFKDKKMSEIAPKDVIAWQNEMMSFRYEDGKACHNPIDRRRKEWEAAPAARSPEDR